MSETTSGTPKLNAALAKMQAQLSTLTRDREVKVSSAKGEYTYAYATLAAIWEAIRKPLTDNGLAVAQLVSTTAKGGIAVTTRLLHESGESIESTCEMPVTQNTPQGLGGAISYGRRYSLGAMVGVVSEDEDDDASAGSGKDAKITKRPAPTAKIPPKVIEAAADEVMREIGALRLAAKAANAPGAVDALRPRYSALQKVMPVAEWTALGEELKARKAEFTVKAAS